MLPILMLAGGCSVSTQPRAAGSPPPGSGPAVSNTYNIGGYQVNKRLFWLGLAGVTILGGVILDNAPDSASNGQFDGMDVVPVGLYGLGTGFLIGAF